MVKSLNSKMQSVVTSKTQWDLEIFCALMNYEFMVEAFQKNLQGKLKIIRKPHLTDNEFKTLCDD